MIDALLFASPTAFSPWGVIAMWAIFAVALLAALRRRLGLGPRSWRIVHMLFAVVIVAGGVVHAMLVEGTMETVSKAVLCALVLAATIKVMTDLVRRKRATLRGREPRATVSSAEQMAIRIFGTCSELVIFANCAARCDVCFGSKAVGS
jgi:predicted ferric reductase